MTGSSSSSSWRSRAWISYGSTKTDAVAFADEALGVALVETVVVEAGAVDATAVVGAFGDAPMCGAVIAPSVPLADAALVAVAFIALVLAFDAAVDRRDPRFAERLREAAPAGIDVYFESVGGEVLDAVLPLLNLGARVPVCGFIAHYNEAGKDEVPAQDRRPALLATLLQKRVRMEGFIVLDHYGDGLSRFKAFQREMLAAIATGEVRALEHVIDGLELAPRGLIDLLDGRHLGKVVVNVAAP